MILSLKEYKNKVLGCWMGKNIGGTLGAPFECKRGVYDIDFYTQDLGGEPLPNDDLDLQLVWLNAVEKYGRGVNASILGEYWHSYIVPNWAEYGAGKNNMRMGLVPPLSGYVNNNYRDSCGAFIRSEIWACLAPGHPEIAVKYAYEDAIVDHSYEGVYGEVFFAAIQSSAFVEKDKYKLIDIGLSYIPEDCGIAKAVKCVIECYKSGLDWKEARKKLLNEVPGSFGMLIGYVDREPEQDVPAGRMGYDAPSNVGIAILGWLYGEDDFGRSLCIAAGCGEDSDCTAATLGAILGIIKGYDSIPEKWIKPLGNTIKTISLNLGDAGIIVPKTVDELTDRVIRLTPVFLGSQFCDTVNSKNGYSIYTLEPSELACHPVRINAYNSYRFEDVLKQQPFGVKYTFPIFDVVVDYCEAPMVKEGVPKKFKLKIKNKLWMQQWLEIKWYLPEGWLISPSNNIGLSLEQYHGNNGKTEAEFELTPLGLNKPKYDLVVAISSQGRHTKGLIPIVLING
ncbi:MAG TPA: ADP-ribosylglycohydrolase family protein [Clostridiaceae bacterium]|nr:ADP-ribosylglycohydrolase family protein [Clostridiaceae bacterium]